MGADAAPDLADRFAAEPWGAWLLVGLGAAVGGFADAAFKAGRGRGPWLLVGLGLSVLRGLSWAQAIRRDGLIGGLARAQIAADTVGLGIVVAAALRSGERPEPRTWVAFGLALLAAAVQP
jgi:hypothetical protein